MELFGDTFTPYGSRDVWAGTRRCPRCVWPSLEPVAALNQENWLCTSCGHCWHVEDGRLRPVDPITCPGCAERSRSDCIALLQREFPRFTAGAASDDLV